MNNLWNTFKNIFRPTYIVQGGYSTVRRPSGDKYKGTVIRRPRKDLSQKQRRKVIQNYKHQKQLLDTIHQKHPQQSKLFNKIIQINQNGQSLMSDLGNTDLFILISKKKKHQLLLDDFENIIKQLYKGFVLMAEIGLIHLDIKPDNIMARYNQETKHFDIVYIDFTNSFFRTELLNRPDFYLYGTTEYMSPQLLQRYYNKNQTKTTSFNSIDMEYLSNDIWSLGITIYALIYATTPFDKQYPYSRATTRNLLDFYKDHQIKFPIEKWMSSTIRKYIENGDLQHMLSYDEDVRLKWLFDKIHQSRSKKTQQKQKPKRQSTQKQKQRTTKTTTTNKKSNK